MVIETMDVINWRVFLQLSRYQQHRPIILRVQLALVRLAVGLVGKRRKVLTYIPDKTVPD